MTDRLFLLVVLVTLLDTIFILALTLLFILVSGYWSLQALRSRSHVEPMAASPHEADWPSVTGSTSEQASSTATIEGKLRSSSSTMAKRSSREKPEIASLNSSSSSVKHPMSRRSQREL